MSTLVSGGGRQHTSLFGHLWQNNVIARRDRFITQHLLGLPPDALVMNVGCGRVRRFGSECSRYLAVDLRQLPNVDVCADVMALPIPDGCLDAIVALELIEHVPRPLTALKELRRAVKPGGTVIVSVPSTVPRHDEHDYWRFTAEGLRQLCLEALGRGEVHVFGGTFETLGTIVEYYMALVFHVLRLPRWRLGRIFPSFGYWLDRRNSWSSSTTDLHTLAFDLVFITTPEGPGGTGDTAVAGDPAD